MSAGQQNLSFGSHADGQDEKEGHQTTYSWKKKEESKRQDRMERARGRKERGEREGTGEKTEVEESKRL